MPSLCVDIDNVLGKTDEVIRQLIRDDTSGRVDLEYTDVIEFEYYKCTDRNRSCITKANWKRIHDLFSDSKYLMAVQPLDNVQQCLEVLSEKFKLHFATSRLPKARRTTIEWLEKHRFPPHDLHFLRHGEKHIVLRGFYAAVEDDYEQATLFAQASIPCYVIEHPWNKGKPPFEDVYPVCDWPTLTEMLLTPAPAVQERIGIG